MVNEDKRVDEKRKLLRQIHKTCLNEAKYYKKKYKRLKMKDDICDVAHTALNMSAVALTISGFGMGLVLSQCQKTYNSKVKLTNYNVALCQYEELCREITAILFRNHMTSNDYQDYIEDVNAKLSMIDDSKLI
jgi:hypothetical protein